MFLYTQKRKEKKQRSVIEAARDFARTILDYGVQIYLLLMLTVFPLYFQEGYAHIGTDKAFFFCKIGVTAGKILAAPLIVYVAAEACVALRQEGRALLSIESRWKKGLTGTDLFALLYGFAVIVSYACSKYRGHALWGAEGWYMGMLPQLMLLAIYFFVSRFWKPRKWLWAGMLLVSAAVFLLGCMNRFGIYPVRMVYAGPQFISTIGNINWYCGYSVAVAFFGVVMLWMGEEQETWWKALLMCYTLLSFLSLVIQGSQSGLVALAVVLLTMFCLSVKNRERMRVFWQEMLLLWGGCLAVWGLRLALPEKMTYTDGLVDLLTFSPFPILMTAVSAAVLLLLWRDQKRQRYREKLFRTAAGAIVLGSAAVVLLALLLTVVNTLRPGSLGALSEYGLFTFDENWGSARGATWAAGWGCFMEQDFLHKLVGVGPDCMPEYIYKGASETLLGLVNHKFEYRLTNAHNEWLTILVNTGLLGAVGFCGMIICGMRELLSQGRKNPYACACGFCMLGYTVNNIFSFQQLLSVGTIFIIFGMGEAFLRRE